MRILFAPFAAKAPSLNGQHSPKDYPYVKSLVELLVASGHEVIQVGGSSDEQVCPDFRKGLLWEDLAGLIQESDTAICVDSLLQHAYWLLGKRAVVIFALSDPLIFGHKENLNLLKSRSSLRQNQFDLYYVNEYCEEAFPSPQEVVDALGKL